MKITKVRTIILEKKLSSSMCISRGGFTVRNHCLVEVTTDQGLTGLGEGIGTARYIKGILDEKMGSLAIGLNPMEIEVVRKKLLDDQVYFERKGSALCAASAIEMACWDIKGKALGVPVYQLLGGMFRSELEAYASDVYWEQDPKSVARSAERIIELGYKTVKAHLGFKGPDEDTKRVKAIRDAIGQDREMMIDLNCGYTFTEASKACQLWEKFNLKWLEEPISPYHISQMSELRKKSRINIAAGENEFRTYGFKDLLDAHAVDIAMPDIGRVGGLQETKNICSLAETYGVEVSPHNFSSGVLLAATMHLMASTPNTGLLEIDTSENAIYHELMVEPLKFKDGAFTVPEQPGLGVHLPKSVLDKYCVSA